MLLRICARRISHIHNSQVMRFKMNEPYFTFIVFFSLIFRNSLVRKKRLHTYAVCIRMQRVLQFQQRSEEAKNKGQRKHKKHEIYVIYIYVVMLSSSIMQ